MRLLAKILPCINHSARLSCSTTNRRYSALVQVIPQNNFLINNNLAAKRTYGCNEKNKELIKQNNGLLKGTQKVTILPVALIHSSSTNNNSLKLLIPLDWLRANEHSMRSIITSIFSKSQNLQKLGKLNSDLKNEAYREKETMGRKSTRTGQKLSLKESQLVKYKNLRNSSAGQYKSENVDFMNVLADAANKSLKQIFVIRTNATAINLNKNENSSILALSVSPLKKNEIAWSKSMPFTEVKSFLTNTFPLTLARKYFSTSTSALMLKTISNPKIYNSQISNILPQGSFQIVVQVISPATKRYGSNNSFRCKPDPNYDFPYLSKIFGTEAFLMRSDAYNQALAESDKRRAALKELKALKNTLRVHPLAQRPKADSGHKTAGPCSSMDKQNKLENVQEIEKKKHKKIIAGCVNPSTQKKQADGGCKKEGPCDSKDNRDGCQEEKEKLENMQEKIEKKKHHKMPTGCVSPKCKKGDKCTQNPKNSPCKKAAATTSGVQVSSEPKTASQQKVAFSSKSKHPTNEEVIKRVIKTSKDCVCSYCKKSGGGGAGGKGKCGAVGGSGKTKPKTKKETCKDDHSDYKPKCNSDPCKKDSPPCGQKKASPCKKKDSGGKKKNESPCKKKKEDPCKKKDPCGDKKKEDPCKKKDPCGDKKKEDPCKKKDPCGGKKKEDPCKKKDPCGDKKKEDPCKKKDPCGDKKKGDPCKKKDPCGGKKKEDPCKKKDPCGDKKKEDPCKKKDPCGDKKKEDPCKNKKGPPKSCASNKKGDAQDKKPTCGLVKGDTKPNCPKDKQRKFSTLPSIRSSHLYTIGNMRHYSSKKGKKGGADGKNSQCKTVQIHVPNQRKDITYPYPKDGLRQCYPIYDMDCTKFCKDPRKTACKKYTFLKDTDDNKRQNKK